MTDTDWIATYRAELESEFAPRRQRALASWPIELGDTTIAGVSCMTASPSGQQTNGNLLYLFGGGFISGSPETDLPIIAPLASQTGLHVIAPRYALAPEHPYPTAIEQVFAVYAQLLQRGHLTGVCGESAGGGLALSLTLKAMVARLALPEKLVLMSPWLDLTEEGINAGAGIDDPTLTERDLKNAASAYLQGADSLANLASPGLAAIPSSIPPVYLSTGGRDMLRPGVLDWHSRLTAEGHECRLMDMPGMWHVFEAYDEFPEALVSLGKAADFLTKATF